MSLRLQIKPFSFNLKQVLRTSKGVIKSKQGWLLNLENSTGKCGWGEVSPIDPLELAKCERALHTLHSQASIEDLETDLTNLPNSLAFGLGAALGELEGVIYAAKQNNWLNPPESAILLPSNGSLLIKSLSSITTKYKSTTCPLTIKWKVAIRENSSEEKLLDQILELLPPSSRLRVDANAGWDRETADTWAKRLSGQPQLEWLEQPLPSNDIEGLIALSKKIPIALDESLIANPVLRKTWHGWQVRRPLLEGDPRPLLFELTEGIGYRVICSAFETGIGRRWIDHLAALQQTGTTPTAPGLAPGWCPESQLFSKDPLEVWEAAECKS